MMAAVTNKGSAHIWDLKQGQAPATDKAEMDAMASYKRKISAHKRYALKVKFSPDSKFLATSSADVDRTLA